MAKTFIEGRLEIDHDRGVVYFQDSASKQCVLLISNLPTPIPALLGNRMLEIRHLIGQDWQGSIRSYPGDPGTYREDIVHEVKHQVAIRMTVAL